LRETSLAKMAWRNLWRNRRRTIITLSSIAFGLLLAVLATGLGDKSWTDLIDLAARMSGGHVTLQHPGYLEAPNLKKTVRHTAALEQKALATRWVERVTTRISGFTMLSTARNSLGAYMIGIDPEKESTETLAALEAIKKGKLFDTADGEGIIIGKGLARNLDAGLGNKVVYTLTDKHGEMVTGLARVSGIVETGADAFDSAFCVLPIDTLRQVLGYEEDEATEVAVFISDQRRTAEVTRALEAEIGSGVAAVPWFENQPELAGFITMKVVGMTFFEVVIMILIAAGIFNTLFVSVMERMREFGIMMAIGFSPGRLFRLVMWESFWLALVGLFAGALLTAWPYHHLSTVGLDMTEMVGKGGSEVAGVVIDPVMRVGIFFENGVIIACATVAAVLLSGLYPAWKAGRVAPTEAIKLV
jgi:ABC-type lipoprotein release transport system permease subunit